MNLANRTIKNALYGLVSYIWPIVFSLALTPIIIHKLGIEQYGLYALTLVISSFSGFLNFGFVYAFVRELSRIRSGGTDKEFEYVRKLYGATILVFIGVGIITFFISVGIAHFGLSLFKLTSDQYSTVRTIFYLTGITALLNNVAVVYSHIPYALQRQDVGTTIYIINIVLVNVLTIAALFFGYGLIAFVSLQVVSALFNVIATYWCSKKLLPTLTPRYTLQKEIIASMGHFGGYIYLHNMSASFLSQIDRIIISATLGPSALTLYALPNSVAEKTQGIIVSLSGILFPVMSELVKEGNAFRIRSAYHQTMRMIAVLGAAITSTILIFADKTLLFWVGKEIATQSTHLIYWLAPTYFLLALFLPTTHVLAAIGKVKFLGVSSLLMAILNVILLFLLIPHYGITGAAMAYLFSLTPLVYIFYHIERWFLKEKHIGILYMKLFAKIMVTSGIFSILVILLFKPFVVNLLTLLIVGMVSIFAYLGCYKVFGFFEEEDWRRFKDFGRMIGTRIFSNT